MSPFTATPGAAAVHLFVRRDSVANLPVGRLKGYPGAYADANFNFEHLRRFAQKLEAGDQCLEERPAAHD